MRTTLITVTLAGSMLVALLMSLGATAAPDDVKSMRVGTYDNRAIAIAYAPSRFNPVKEKMKAMKAAEAAGDTELIEELEAWGQKHQRQLHRQGFGKMPVDDLLAHVKARLPDVARRAGVDAIVWQCDYLGPGVEKVDVTMDLVQLFDPSDRTLTWAKQIRDQKFVDLDTLEESHDH